MNTDKRNLITKGHYAISIPILGIYASAIYFFELSFLVISISTIVAWTFWSYMVPKWKLSSIKQLSSTEDYVNWYSNSIASFLIWPDSNWFNQTEFWTEKDKDEYQELRKSLLNIQ